MPCYHPKQAWLVGFKSNGKKDIVFKSSCKAIEEMKVPCGHCIGCLEARTKTWALRMVKHAQMCDPINYPGKIGSCFITLTYNDEYLRSDRSLDLRHWQLFMKRLRDHFPPGIQYYHCGEYGSKWGRPHYHACMFNCSFTDLELLSVKRGIPLYKSKLLQSVWSDPKTGKPIGHVSVGQLNIKTAAYAARYSMKKHYGVTHYLEGVDMSTNEVVVLKPEYATMSNGIAREWLKMYLSDVYPLDFVQHNGIKYKTPRYFDNYLELTDPQLLSALRIKRKEFAMKRVCSPQQLSAGETIKRASLSLLKRDIE